MGVPKNQGALIWSPKKSRALILRTPAKRAPISRSSHARRSFRKKCVSLSKGSDIAEKLRANPGILDTLLGGCMQCAGRD